MKTQIFFLLIVLLFPSVLWAQNCGTLSFDVIGFADNSGQLLVELFRKEDKVPIKPFKLIKVKIADKKTQVTIDDFLYGDYAAIFVHDKNANGEVDHRWGIPSEPLGFTNNWELSLFSGMPTFEKLKFTFDASKKHFQVKMPD